MALCPRASIGFGYARDKPSSLCLSWLVVFRAASLQVLMSIDSLVPEFYLYPFFALEGCGFFSSSGGRRYAIRGGLVSFFSRLFLFFLASSDCEVRFPPLLLSNVWSPLLRLELLCLGGCSSLGSRPPSLRNCSRFVLLEMSGTFSVLFLVYSSPLSGFRLSSRLAGSRPLLSRR